MLPSFSSCFHSLISQKILFTHLTYKPKPQAFTSSADGSCILWDLDAKSRSMCLFESTMFKALTYHPDESQVLTTGSDRKITYWDTFDGQAIRILEGSPEAEVATLSMSASGSHFASGSADRLVKFWNYDTGLVHSH